MDTNHADLWPDYDPYGNPARGFYNPYGDPGVALLIWGGPLGVYIEMGTLGGVY